MYLRAVSKNRQPAYPTRREFLAIGASVLAAAGVSGCGRSSSSTGSTAPVFVHGEGRGAMGCVVLTPPVFLSEEEALQVVREEFAAIGVHLGRGMAMPNVVVEREDPFAKWLASEDNWLGDPVLTISHSAKLSAVDHQKGIGVTVITSEDCNDFGDGQMGTVRGFNTKSVAESYVDAFRTQARTPLRIGVFYDPLEEDEWVFDIEPDGEESEESESSEDYGKTIEEVEADAAERSRAKLRRQVQDFVVWLETNG